MHSTTDQRSTRSTKIKRPTLSGTVKDVSSSIRAADKTATIAGWASMKAEKFWKDRDKDSKCKWPTSLNQCSNRCTKTTLVCTMLRINSNSCHSSNNTMLHSNNSPNIQIIELTNPSVFASSEQYIKSIN